METREVAQEVRLSRWAELLREQKSSGMNIKNWCEAQGVSRAQFFYWQKKLRESVCRELIKGENPADDESPLGWALCTTDTGIEMDKATEESEICDQLTIEVSGIRITAGREYPADKLAQLLRELQKSC